MRFYDKYFKNSYEELLTYYPEFYKNVYEMNEILKAFGSISDDLEAQVERAYLDNFILTADSETIKIWESVLRITYKEKLSLEQRKRVVIGRISGGKHIGEQEIRSIVANYSDKPVSVDFHDGTIFIVLSGEIFDDDNFLGTLLGRIPAHLRLKVDIHIKQRYEYQIGVNSDGIVSAYISAQPVKQDRTAKTDVRLSQGTYTKNSGLARPPNVKNKSLLESKGAGGMYCRTHIKSKLIG